MLKYITVLGSTGSIGKSTLDVIRNSNMLRVHALSTNANIELLERQVIEFLPSAVAIKNLDAAAKFEQICKDNGYFVKVYKGKDAAEKVAVLDRTHMVLVAILGNAGIKPTLASLQAGKDVAIANKEAIVSAGELIVKTAKRHGCSLIPVDSEHSAIFQCLNGTAKGSISKLIITASGGAFRGRKREELITAKAEDALKHPTWDMGAKITIDSATLMNKGLEVIEASFLFGVKPENITTIVHPQSIIHSMVEFKDGVVLAQMGNPDMRFPIQYALNYPERYSNPFPKLDFTKTNELTFENPDVNTFPCLRLAYDAIKIGGTAPCVLNEVNHAMVNLYLRGDVGFYDIPQVITKALESYTPVYDYNLRHIDAAIAWARDFVLSEVIRVGR